MWDLLTGVPTSPPRCAHPSTHVSSGERRQGRIDYRSNCHGREGWTPPGYASPPQTGTGAPPKRVRFGHNGKVNRNIEASPGDEAEVWVRDRGSNSPRLRGTVVIEDLTCVLTRIANRSGANGPQSPVTQYILSQAAEHLAERLIGDIGNPAEGESVPRTLSGTLGHQPFIETTLGMSQHQMLRRWPLATDWYTDVINYVLRPSRFGSVHITTAENITDWSKGTLGEFLRLFTEHQVASFGDRRQIRMAEALQSLWPDYPPVKDAIVAYRKMVKNTWLPLYQTAMQIYGLGFRPGVAPEELGWIFNAIHSRETLESLSDPDMPGFTDSAGRRWSLTARSALIVIAGSCVDSQGRVLSLEELEQLRPV